MAPPILVAVMKKTPLHQINYNMKKFVRVETTVVDNIKVTIDILLRL